MESRSTLLDTPDRLQQESIDSNRTRAMKHQAEAGDILMSEKPFKPLLERAGLTKTALSKALGLNLNTVSKWGDSPPRYALAYVELLIEYNRYRP